MDTYADDLAKLIDTLDLHDVVLVGHSTGGGEITRYIGRHGTARVAKIVLVGAVPPLMLKTAGNPEGLPREVFDGIRKGAFENRSQFFKDLTIPLYGFNRDGAHVSEGLRDFFWLQGMMGGIKGQLDCIKQFSKTDFTQDLEKIDVPTLIIHGDDDQIVPIGAAAVTALAPLTGISSTPTFSPSSRIRSPAWLPRNTYRGPLPRERRSDRQLRSQQEMRATNPAHPKAGNRPLHAGTHP